MDDFWTRKEKGRTSVSWRERQKKRGSMGSEKYGFWGGTGSVRGVTEKEVDRKTVEKGGS